MMEGCDAVQRLLGLLALFVLMCACAVAEAPERVSQVTTLEEAALFVDLAEAADGSITARDVSVGRLRHISQSSNRPGFCEPYWINEQYDLAQEYSPSGRKYGYYARNMCTRAAYSEILSYFGIDMTPVAMSTLLGERNIDNPYDAVTAMIPGLTRMQENSYPEFDLMLERYMTDPSYSPIMLIMINPKNSMMHTVLVLGVMADGQLICLDSAYHPVGGKPMWIFRMKLAGNRQYVRYSMSDSYNGLPIRACYQWRYTPADEQ